MEKEPTPQTEALPTPPVVDLTDIEAHEVAQRGQDVLELSRELNSSSKALLEQLDPA